MPMMKCDRDGRILGWFRHRATSASSLGESGELCFLREFDALPHREMRLFKLRHHMRLFGFMSDNTFRCSARAPFCLEALIGGRDTGAMLDRVA